MAVKKKTNKKGNENLDDKSQDTQEQAVDSNNQENDAGKEDVQEQTPEEKYNELNNRFMRLYAEFETFRKRTNKERLDIITNANADLLKDLIPVIDDFERAISNNEDSEDVVAIKEGFSLIYNKYTGILKTKGLKPMERKEKFLILRCMKRLLICLLKIKSLRVKLLMTLRRVIC